MCGQYGKNNVGDKNKFLPTVYGFDEFFGNLYHLNAEEEPEELPSATKNGVAPALACERNRLESLTPYRNSHCLWLCKRSKIEV
jgi:arylsulfatase A-like enzyme